MPRPGWRAPLFTPRQKKVLSAVTARIQQLYSILQSGNKILKESHSKSEYSAFCIQRFVGSAMNRFFSAKFEILSNTKIKLKRSKRCMECVRTENILREVRDLLKSPAMTFDKLQSEMKAILEKVVMVPGNNEVERSSDTVINEFIECINKTKEESREVAAAMKLSKEATAKLKDQINKAFADGYYGDESSVPDLQRAARELLARNSEFLDSHYGTLHREIARHKVIIKDGCLDCLTAQVNRFEQMIEGLRDYLQPLRRMIPTTITQEMIDKKEATCLVCLDVLPIGFPSAYSCPGCHHVFDKDCISKWLKENTNCPHCRHMLRARVNLADTMDQLHPFFNTY